MMTPSEVVHTSKPFSNQKDELAHWTTPERAIFWEQGTGKTKMVFDWMQLLWSNDKIDSMIVLSPNSLERNWIEMGFGGGLEDPIIPHLFSQYIWKGELTTKNHARMNSWQILCDLQDAYSFVFIVASHSVVRTKWGYDYLLRFLRSHRCALVVDESSVMETSRSLITKQMMKLSLHAKFKRILDGTPVDEGAFNIYPQMRFLNRGFWEQFGIRNLKDFKHEFADWEESWNHQGESAQRYEVFKSWKNLDVLNRYLKPYITRVLKKDVLDLPPKRRNRLNFELGKSQKAAYDKVDLELYTVLERDTHDQLYNEMVTAEIPIVEVRRLYQITCGYLPLPKVQEETETLFHVFDENPRLEVACEFLDAQKEKTVVWCLQHRDIDLLMARLGDRAVVFDGRRTPEQKETAKKAFTTGDTQYLVAQIDSMARGHTLNMAHEVLYYTCDSRLRMRQQSEDRTHRGTMGHSVRYTDMICRDTVDEKRLVSLNEKLKVAKEILGDDY